MTIEVYHHESYSVYKLRMESGSFINYNYVIVDKVTSIAAIVDPAWRFDVIQQLVKVAGIKLTHVLLTHSHFDHVDLAERVAKEHLCEIVAHEEEISYYKLSLSNLRAVEHLSKIPLGETTVTCIHTPGHTKGSLCYLLNNSLISGDTLFNEGCGVCHLDGGNAGSMFDSLNMLKHNVGESVRVFPGHSFGSDLGKTFGEVQDMNIYFHIKKKKQFIAFRMASGKKRIFSFN